MSVAIDAIRSRPPSVVQNVWPYFWIGATDQVFEELDKMITERTLNPPRLVTLRPLRNDARWEPMLRRMGLEP